MNITDETRATITNNFCAVFEQFSFMIVNPEHKDNLEQEVSGCLNASIRFSGHRKGSLLLAVPNNMCPELAANILGVEKSQVQGSETCADALKEMLNITCANLLTAIHGEEPFFDISLPIAVSMNRSQWSSLLEDERTQAFRIDGHPCLLLYREENRT